MRLLINLLGFYGTFGKVETIWFLVISIMIPEKPCNWQKLNQGFGLKHIELFHKGSPNIGNEVQIIFPTYRVEGALRMGLGKTKIISHDKVGIVH